MKSIVICCVVTLSASSAICHAKGNKNSGPQNVTVKNNAADPVPVTVQHAVTTVGADNPANQPFAKEDLQVFTTAVPVTIVSTFDVPAGKRLVLKLATAFGTVASGNDVTAYVQTRQPDGSFVTHNLVVEQTATDVSGHVLYAMSRSLELYADPGAGSVKVSVSHQKTTDVFTAGISIAGHLVDLP